ncbi:hypothetical protein THAOC_37283 [Thalassiosira oceanica]|uniref:F-box domain-containing protein n=1 Tax=Thalassiosira oceanica TaxID=159749 RepID=K0QZ13_THAOC|nr:hypothetical protein THAOC_37283 [Thalassiosira oceanica]|eukprot:EJK44200.1 hypothetical protein THAOC_37283 [Thalassiosira oceanica]
MSARMADDGRAKRLKTAEGDIAAASAAEVAELRRRNAELETEIEQLRRRVQNLEGNHEALPVSVPPATVDLSRVDTSLVTQISSFLGTSHELRNLALTCKSFGRRQPTSSLNWSLVEEVARQAVCSQATDSDMSSLPQYVGGTMTWLSILNRFEHPLLFGVLLGNNIEYRNGDKATVQGTLGEHEHCAIKRLLGVKAFYPKFLAQRSVEWGDGNVHVCEYACYDGTMSWTDWEDDNEEINFNLDWVGMEGCGSGDTIGMLLNLDEGTLTVYKNDRRLGVLRDGLSGSYCWYVCLCGDHTVSIQGGTPPNIANTMAT